MRILPETIKSILGEDYAETHEILELTIPAQFTPTTYPETKIYLATADNVYVGAQYYEPALRSVNSIKFSMGRAPDNAEVVIENVSGILGFTVLDSERSLDGARAVIKKAYRISDGSYETYPIFVGYVRDMKVTREAVTLSIISDMSRVGTNVAGRTATQRCIWNFNVYGSGIGPQCGWQTSQPGDPVSCDYGTDTPNGCKSHGNMHRFGGVPSFSVLGSSGYDSNNPNWPDPDHMPWCVSPDSTILTIKEDGTRYWLKARNVVYGDTIVSINRFGNLVKTQVLGARVGHTTRLYNFTTKRGLGLSCSPSHLIMQGIGYSEGKPAHKYKIGDKVLVYRYSHLKAVEDNIASIEVVDVDSEVILFQLDTPNHTFVSGDSESGGIVSHNLKPILQNGEVYNF